MYSFPVYFTLKQKIEFLQRVILIHSFLYYEKDSPIVSDKWYDKVSKQLYTLQKEYNIKHEIHEFAKYTQYGYAFHDFDGSTGFDLWDRLKHKDKQFIEQIANMLLKGRR